MRDQMVKPVAAAAASATLVGALGALATGLGPWYFQLRKPSWQPPDWLFGPAWALIFALAALAGVWFWRSCGDHDRRVRLLWAFGLNALLNIVWSLLFFRFQRPDWALAEVGLLWLSILLLIMLLSEGSRRAAWLLSPYLVWVTFASFLNWTIVKLNESVGSSG